MFTIGQVKAHILDIVTRAPDRRIRPIDLERAVMGEGEPSKAAIKRALRNLIQAGRLVYTYRDPCSFVEIPAVETQPSA